MTRDGDMEVSPVLTSMTRPPMLHDRRPSALPVTMMARNPITIVVGILLASALLGGCVENDREGATRDNTPLQSTSASAADVVLIVHTGMPENDLQLHPELLSVAQGDVVELRISNDGFTAHTYAIHDFGVDTGMLQPDEERVITFRADRAGDFEIACDAPGHYEAGMRATLHVS